MGGQRVDSWTLAVAEPKRKDNTMTARPSNKATIDGVTRFIAYQCDHGKKKPHDRRCAVGAG
jgi:hypothetical protein